MVKKEQVPARAVFVQASLWVWSATSRGRPHDGGGASCPTCDELPAGFDRSRTYDLRHSRLDDIRAVLRRAGRKVL